MPNKPNTPLNCELHWSTQWHAHDRGRRLIASVGRSSPVWPAKWGLHTVGKGQSPISTIALLNIEDVQQFCKVVTKSLNIFIRIPLSFMSMAVLMTSKKIS